MSAFAAAYLTGKIASDNAPTAHGRPVTINITVDLPTFLGLTDHPGELLGTGEMIPADVIRELIPDAKLRRLILDPMTGHLLDYGRKTYRVPADLAAFTRAKWVTSSGPHSQVSTDDVDMDHGRPYDDGGPTDRINMNPANRRWHRAKTIGGWTVSPNERGGWTWTSPLGQSVDTDPHDYRLGP
jgi:hypothetical protein